MTATARQGIGPNEITSPAMSPLTTIARPRAATIAPTSSGKAPGPIRSGVPSS